MLCVQNQSEISLLLVDLKRLLRYNLIVFEAIIRIRNDDIII